MKYIITYKDPATNEQVVFSTDWFQESYFNPDVEMVVVDVRRMLFTVDGVVWDDVEKDLL